jgi:ubiquinone/menaquinone biosynthesis C-methylase UbiE
VAAGGPPRGVRRGLQERATSGVELSPREGGAGDHAEGWGAGTVAAYDAWEESPLGRLVARLEREAVFALVPTAPGGCALDLSCGTGGYALGLVERGFRAVGLDLSAAMLARASARAQGARAPLALVRADAGALPFRAGAFALVTLILGLEFLSDPAPALAEARRVLQPGGVLVVAILNRSGLWTMWRRLKRLVLPSIWRGAIFLTPPELGGLLEASGFTDLRSGSAVHFLPLLGTRRVRWLERWERLAARWMPERATFVVVAARRA